MTDHLFDELPEDGAVTLDDGVPPSMPSSPEIVMLADSQVAPSEIEHATRVVGATLGRLRIRGGARVRMSCHNEAKRLVVQVNLRVAGGPTRMQTLAPLHNPFSFAAMRLRDQIRAVSDPIWRPRAWPDTSRPLLAWPGHGDIARRKSFALAVTEPLAAATFMDAMDYTIHLFTDAETGEDAVVFRAGPLGLRLARQALKHPPRISGTRLAQPLLLTVHPYTTPLLPEQSAVRRLCEHGLPFLFFTDLGSGRGRLLYRRFDGALGLIGPAA